jgi:cob(I)alamin adenosyltransferase
MSIATRGGDDGTTSLLYGGRISKASDRVEAYGTLDELGAQLGLARSFCEDSPATAERIAGLQRFLFVLGTELATPPAERRRLLQRLTPADLAGLDAEVARIEARPGLLNDWALPGETRVGSFLDVARTVCRRAERRVVALVDRGEETDVLGVEYLNRLADVLWLWAREYELDHGADARLRR